MSNAMLSVLAGVLLTVPLLSPQSSNHILTDFSFSAGGADAELSSVDYRATFVNVGMGASQHSLSSAFYSAAISFDVAYSPSGEVHELRFADAETLVWNPDPFGGHYNLYRELLSNLLSGFGACLQHDITATTTVDSASPPGGDAYFYLVTAENRLNEEGTKGYGSSGAERTNSDPCP